MRGDLVQVGPRPCYLVDDMEEGELKDELQQCENNTFYRTDFSIGHRGAAMQFPKHTIEPYMAAAHMGAGILECDVTLTADRELVCRHSQCDLHTTTNILAIPELSAKCSKPFTPARFNADGSVKTLAFAKCCTSDITLDDFKSLCGKMDAADTSATTVEAYMGGTATWRTDLYATWSPSIGELVDQGVSIIDHRPGCSWLLRMVRLYLQYMPRLRKQQDLISIPGPWNALGCW